MSIDALRSQLSSVIRGKEKVLDRFLVGLLAGGHLLLEDLPGTGKTSLARALVQSISGDGEALVFRRLQCTPDLLPSDVTGVDVYDPARRRFFFAPGPVFTHVLLVDEINRATPKVQSALLEVMNEGQVSVGGTSYRLDDFFLVIATENPVTMEGTYPLPLAQLDRFGMRLALGYPDVEAEVSVLTDDPSHTVLPKIQPVIARSELLELRAQARQVFCHPRVARAVVDLADRTRRDPRLRYGVSPRGSLQLLAAARARASLRGREYVNDEDLTDLAVPVLAHRVRPATGEHDPADIIAELCATVVADLEEHDGV